MSFFRILILFSMFAARVQAQVVETPHDLAHGYAPGFDPGAVNCCETVYGKDDAPAWLDRVLKKLASARPQHIKLGQYALFKVAEKPEYLGLVWSNRSNGYMTFQLYRVRVKSPGNVRLRGLIERRDALLEMHHATGRWRDIDGAPLLVLSYGSGGSGWFGYRLEILKLADGVRNVTPKGMGRPIRVQDWNRDGRWEVVTSDDRWANYFFGCGVCGPFVPIVLERTANGFRPGCREHAVYFRDRARRKLEALERSEGHAPWVYFQEMTDAMLSLLQSGNIEKGRELYQSLVANPRWDPATSELDGKELATLNKFAAMTERTFGPIVEGASRLDQADCLVSAIEAEPEHPGFEERVNRFRN